jgi:hypothetical protein
LLACVQQLSWQNLLQLVDSMSLGFLVVLFLALTAETAAFRVAKVSSTRWDDPRYIASRIQRENDPVRQAALIRQLDWLQPHIRTSPPPLYVASQLRPDEEPVQDWQEPQRYTDLPSEQQRIIAAAMATRNTPTSSPGLFNPAVKQSETGMTAVLLMSPHIFLLGVVVLTSVAGLRALLSRITLRRTTFGSAPVETSTSDTSPSSFDLFHWMWRLSAEVRAVIMVIATILVFEIQLGVNVKILSTNAVLLFGALICRRALRIYPHEVKLDALFRSVSAGFMYFVLLTGWQYLVFYLIEPEFSSPFEVVTFSLILFSLIVACIVEESVRYLLVLRAFNEGVRATNGLLLHAVAANTAIGVCKAVFQCIKFWNDDVDWVGMQFLRAILLTLLHVALGVVVMTGFARILLLQHTAPSRASEVVHILLPAVVLRGLWSFSRAFQTNAAAALFDAASVACRLPPTFNSDAFDACLETTPELATLSLLSGVATFVYATFSVVIPLVSIMVARLQLYSLRYAEIEVRKTEKSDKQTESDTEALLATLASRGWTIAPPLSAQHEVSK